MTLYLNIKVNKKEEMHPNKWGQKKGKKTTLNHTEGNHTVQPQCPVQEEDWEKELEEISQRIEMQKQPPYGNSIC